MESPFTDADLINFWCDQADREERPISNCVARCIAAQLHNGWGSAYLALATTGAIEQADLEWEIASDYHNPHTTTEVQNWLCHLEYFVIEHGERGPQEGWHKLWPAPRIGDAA